MSEVYTSEVFARCVACDDSIRLGDEVTEFAGELFHAECV
ncbi:hypothetical protein SEA_KAHLID_103 [Mycobacterium phage Kahlid]|uniref:Uncharacterized protein n=1 Tax=Mycobacterium phage GuuelaD TaxID=2015819 RepID=A0A286MQK8_9CAUD|nr:hypothetical protein J4T97_gp099 [Mycobacterium phage GuuelaD]AOT23090.1 hypothetical protein SEA_WILDER_103 [Mycobacterium phage Wilder]ASW31533.1 hypothetical protein SEA_GUUELAD_99 [Mycobacterium phage GuuelaD]QGJ96411.1 hypothetical protein SEA_KAHLID_103 [Mycobacterium phage Kahlid]